MCPVGALACSYISIYELYTESTNAVVFELSAYFIIIHEYYYLLQVHRQAIISLHS